MDGVYISVCQRTQSPLPSQPKISTQHSVSSHPTTKESHAMTWSENWSPTFAHSLQLNSIRLWRKRCLLETHTQPPAPTPWPSPTWRNFWNWRTTVRMCRVKSWMDFNPVMPSKYFVCFWTFSLFFIIISQFSPYYSMFLFLNYFTIIFHTFHCFYCWIISLFYLKNLHLYVTILHLSLT